MLSAHSAHLAGNMAAHSLLGNFPYRRDTRASVTQLQFLKNFLVTWTNYCGETGDGPFEGPVPGGKFHRCGQGEVLCKLDNCTDPTVGCVQPLGSPEQLRCARL